MSAKRSMSDDSKSDAAAQARSYPRKRVSIACEVCRLRKTRCDAAKPSCSFCADLGIECVYKRPADASRPENRLEELSIALKRLDKIETTLDSIAQKVGVGDQPGRFQPPVPEPSPFVSTPLAFRNDPVTPSPASVSTAARQSRNRYACKMPNLFVFKHPLPELGDWSYNNSEFFFTDQIDVIADMRQHLHLPHPNPDLSEVHLKQLQISFAENVLKWLPLFDPDTAMQHIRYARSTDYQHTGPSLCLVFLVYANGAISQDTSLYSRSAHELPGFAYYAKALSVLHALPAPTKDLTILQCRLLVTIYLLFAMRPLEAWRTITQASQECIVLLRTNLSNDASVDVEMYRGAFSRIYWICYVLESELEACLEVPSSGIRQYESLVPLPTSHYEEDGMYFLLALSSLRKVMVEVIDTVGYKSSSNFITYNPAVALELRSQIDAWYHHLPAPLRFPLDGPPLFDIRKAYLRCCYYALTAVGTWPFVISLSQAPPSANIQISHSVDYGSQSRQNSMSAPTGGLSSSTSAVDGYHHNHQHGTGSISSQSPLIVGGGSGDHELGAEAAMPPPHHHQSAGQRCLEACRLYLHHAEEILTHKCLVSHLIVRQYYAFTIILILTFGGVDLQNGGSLEERRVLENAMRNLGYWGVVPFMVPSLRDMRNIASDRGLGRGLG